MTNDTFLFDFTPTCHSRAGGYMIWSHNNNKYILATNHLPRWTIVLLYFFSSVEFLSLLMLTNEHWTNGIYYVFSPSSTWQMFRQWLSYNNWNGGSCMTCTLNQSSKYIEVILFLSFFHHIHYPTYAISPSINENEFLLSSIKI